ncbi:unnamed protein product [Alopecurus aequalis]
MGSLRTCRETSRDMLHEILMKLPARDVARSCCVSRLWHSVAGDPSFRNLHGAMASHVTSARAETLLVTVNRKPGRSDEASVFNVSSGKKAMCCVPIPPGYGLANVCNGFLCFMHAHGYEAPALVCNPVTGETVSLPWAPRLLGSEKAVGHLFALGFSSSTKEYKLFRISYPFTYSLSSDEQPMVVDMYTLGDTGGWRKRSFLSRYRPIISGRRWTCMQVLLHDKIYMLTDRFNKREIPRRMLVIDVATESCCTYGLPDYETRHYEQPMVGVFELNGQLWFVAHVSSPTERIAIRFWVMSPPGDKDPAVDKEPRWDLCYNFHNEGFTFDRPWGCWLEDEMMCYFMNDTLLRYDTRKRPPISTSSCLPWDTKLKLPRAPSMPKCQWNIFRGYRPTLLSPLTFPMSPSQDDDEDKHQFEHDMFSLLRTMGSVDQSLALR